LSSIPTKFITAATTTTTTTTFAIVYILKMFQYKIGGYIYDLLQHILHALLQGSLATTSKQKPQTQRPGSQNTVLYFAQNLPKKIILLHTKLQAPPQ
jgi:hypothetical protein